MTSCKAELAVPAGPVGEIEAGSLASPTRLLGGGEGGRGPRGEDGDPKEPWADASKLRRVRERPEGRSQEIPSETEENQEIGEFRDSGPGSI